MQHIPQPWLDPATHAASVMEINKSDAVFLHSALSDTNHQYSILAINPVETVKGDNYDTFSEKLSTTETTSFHNAWFGYLGYGLKHTSEILPQDQPGLFSIPNLWMNRYQQIWVWNHKEKSLDLWSESPQIGVMGNNRPNLNYLEKNILSLHSNMTKEAYLLNVKKIIDCIYQGDLSQANLTRKFYGEYKQTISPFALFARLAAESPSSYTAYMRFGGTHILSSSPEQFLKIDAPGFSISNPIKGTATRAGTEIDDDMIFHNFEKSEKNRAENLMIVDLMRHDFSKGAVPGSVKTPSLFNITRHTNLHHMHSTITAQKRADVSTLDFVKNCFPPGSMTGTPKIKAMELCSALEKQERGVYSGALGWFGGDGSCDLSVVIRTIITDGKRFEFQVGGAIVADSDPEEEWQETMLKAKAICAALDIDYHSLSAI